MGGLVTESCLLQSYLKENFEERGIFRETKGLIFFGTPHGGSGLAATLASILSAISSVVRCANFVESVSELKKGSKSLQMLSNLFESLPGQSDREVLTFVETKATCLTVIVPKF
jgi:hypothetical protein